MDDGPTWLSATPAQRIVGRTVILQRWNDADLDSMLHAILSSMEQLTRWMPRAYGYDRQRGAEFLRRSQDEWDARTGFQYAIRTPDATLRRIRQRVAARVSLVDDDDRALLL